VSSLFENVSTTSYGNWNPNTTSTPTDTADPYGQAAWSAMWKDAALANFTRGLYSTTASPTPIPTSELVLPPPLYFQPTDCDQFPYGFILGVAGAAAQIEGAIADEGRGPASPDFTGQENLLGLDLSAELGVPQIDNDFTAIESYYLYKRDIDRLVAIGSKYYSFSISWTRILPFALPGTPVNSQGLEHYDDLINYAISKGVQPVVTLIHLDTPAAFFGNGVLNYMLSTRSYFSQNAAGYENTTFEDAFVHYGQIVLSHFADRVPIWITYNEPQNGATNGVAIDHILRSHARLYHFYHEVLHGKGKMSFKNGVAPNVPQDPRNASHVAATKHYNDLYLSSFLNPLALGEDYPDAYKMTIQDYVPLSSQDLDYMRGTIGTCAQPSFLSSQSLTRLHRLHRR
jgi:beta-glucosidase/6-phospho-beta-glucosidase/beta-galactosidase